MSVSPPTPHQVSHGSSIHKIADTLWVEHPFHIVKNLFRHKKLRYRGLAKNTAQLHTLFALANLAIVKNTLLAPAQAQVPGACQWHNNARSSRHYSGSTLKFC